MCSNAQQQTNLANSNVIGIANGDIVFCVSTANIAKTIKTAFVASDTELQVMYPTDHAPTAHVGHKALAKSVAKQIPHIKKQFFGVFSENEKEIDDSDCLKLSRHVKTKITMAYVLVKAYGSRHAQKQNR